MSLTAILAIFFLLETITAQEKVTHRCHSGYNCTGAVLEGYVTREECCLHSEQGYSYFTQDDCRPCVVHGFTRDSYEVVEGETVTVTLDINLKGRTAFPFLQINGVIMSDNTADIVPINVAVPALGITFNVTATEDDIALENDSVILRFEHLFGPIFIERVEGAGEYFRDTTTIRIIDNDVCEIGGQVFTECGTACPPVCGEEQPLFCTLQCVVGCQCPPGTLLDRVANECVTECPNGTTPLPTSSPQPPACEIRGQVFTECGTACPPVCGEEQPLFCTLQCVVGCQCPPGTLLDRVANECVTECPNVTVCEGGYIRLAGGNGTAGRVEVCIGGIWGTVCDDFWDNVDARVVCRQLGLPSSSAIAFQRARFGAGSGPILLDDIQCTGNETSLLQCSHGGIRNHNCVHHEDASVSCFNGAPPPTGRPQPTPTPTRPTVTECEGRAIRLAGGSDIAGRVEVCFNGVWGTVCDDFWDDADARVVCRQLGLPSSYATAYYFARYGEGQGPIYLDDVQCSGSESSLLECDHNGVENHNCAHFEDAGVACGALPTTGRPQPTFTPTPPTETCDEDDFLCPNDPYLHCIPYSYLCDSEDDCLDGYDELNCSTIDLGSPPEMTIVEGEEEHFQLCLTVTEGFDRDIFRQFTAQTIPVGRAQYGRDFNATNFNITFNGSYSVGDDECAVSTVSAKDDGIVEGTESFGVLIQPEISTIPIVFIIDNDYLSIGFQEVSYTVSESAGVIELTVSPDGTGGIPGVGVPLGVRITSRDGSAEAGRDYQGVVSTHYFSPPLARGFVVRVNIVDDALTEGEERFSVELSAFDISVVLVNSVAEIVIEDDDTSVSTCPQLPNPPNGSVQYNSVDVEALAEYSCDCGFTMVGAPYRVCRLDYIWSGQEPVCQTQSPDGVCTVDREVVDVDGNTATYSFCGVGFDIDSFICKLDGRILPDCSSPLTGLSSGTHRLRIVPVGCSANRGKTIRFDV